jgi:hypothetical protein
MRLFLVSSVAVAVAGCVLAASVLGGDAKLKGPEPGKLRHVVLLKFKRGTTPEQIKAIEDAFRALPAKIPEIVQFEWGTNNSPENRNDGFTHCFFLTFRAAAARDMYLVHPAHKKFGKLLGPRLDKVLVIDYLPRE